MSSTDRGLKIAQLEQLSGVGRSTIHHYVNVGLLPGPRALGPKLHLFDQEHVARLAEIVRLRGQGMPLARIREELARFETPETEPGQAHGGAALRERILEQATRQFAERGYEGVRLIDVARVLGIGKATIYRHFSSKQALFVDCVERVRFTLLPRELREKSEKRDPRGQGRHRAAGVLANFAAYRTITHLLGSLAHGSDPRLARKARTELHGMITNAEPFLRGLIEQKQIRDFDSELLAYMLWGALMGAGERLTLDRRYTFEQVLQAYTDFVQLGLLAR